MTWDLRPSRSGNFRPRVLCVDDEPVVLQILHRLLEVQGFEAVTCGDPLDRAWAELRAHAGTQFDPEIVAVFGQVVDENGNLRKLDPALESTLNSGVHIARSSAQGLIAPLAMMPTLEPMAMPVEVTLEHCSVTPAGAESEAIASGAGCDIVIPEEGATDPTAATRQVA